nr:hypothetical protein CFP56_37796 [Quercus suber]
MTKLVKGHEEIHVYVEYPIDNPILVDEGEDVSEGVQPLAVEQGPMGYYSDYSDDDDHDGGEFYSFYDSDDMYANDQTFNNEDESTEVVASYVGSRRVGKEPIIEHSPEVFTVSDGSDSGGSGGGRSALDDEVELNQGVWDFVEDNSDNWDGKDDDDVVEPCLMGTGVMNSDYKSEELHSLVESSSDDELGYNSDDISEDDRSTHVGNVKASRARDKAIEYVDGAYIQQYNQLWEYCEELRRFSLGSIMLMKAAKATYKQEFDRVMDEQKEIDADAYNWLDVHSTTKWARHMFSEDGLTDTILNNMCESFNNRILKFISKLIISMSMLRANHITNHWPEYVETKWCDFSLAHIKRRPIGRPKKKRAREPNEPTSKRVGISKQCKACGKLGHNRRSCKDEIGGNSSLPGTTNRISTYNKKHKCTIIGQDSLSHTICTTPGQHA